MVHGNQTPDLKKEDLMEELKNATEIATNYLNYNR